MNYLTEKRKMKRNISCITDYGRDGYGVSGSAWTDNLAGGKPTSGYKSGPANLYRPMQQVAEFIKEKTGYDVLGKDTLSFIVSILPRVGQIIMEGIQQPCSQSICHGIRTILYVDRRKKDGSLCE